MNLKKGNWLYNFYHLNYAKWGVKDEITNNFCDFFWGILLAVVSLPLTWFALLFNYFTKSRQGYWSNLFHSVIFDYGLSSVILVIVAWISQKPIKHLEYVGLLLVVVTLLCSILYFFIEVWPNTNLSNNIVELQQTSKEGFKAFKGKYCPKITWID